MVRCRHFLDQTEVEMYHLKGTILSATSSILLVCATSAYAAQTTVPQSALIASGQYFTDIIGGGIGSIVVMTGGGATPGIGDPTGRNDDGFRGPISFGYTFKLFGTNYTSFYANNNGNISFGAGISAYVPTGPTGANVPVISAWFGDVDTTSAASGVLRLRQDVAQETILTWDKVGYYNSHGDLLDSFQMVVRGPGYSVPNGEGVVGFFYKTMSWERTDTSITAAVGFGDGLGNSVVLAGSNVAGLNPVVANHYIWFDQTLIPVVPEPSSYLLMLFGIGVISTRFCRRK